MVLNLVVRSLLFYSLAFCVLSSPHPTSGLSRPSRNAPNIRSPASTTSIPRILLTDPTNQSHYILPKEPTISRPSHEDAKKDTLGKPTESSTVGGKNAVVNKLPETTVPSADAPKRKSISLSSPGRSAPVTIATPGTGAASFVYKETKPANAPTEHRAVTAGGDIESQAQKSLLSVSLQTTSLASSVYPHTIQKVLKDFKTRKFYRQMHLHNHIALMLGLSHKEPEIQEDDDTMEPYRKAQETLKQFLISHPRSSHQFWRDAGVGLPLQYQYLGSQIYFAHVRSKGLSWGWSLWPDLKPIGRTCEDLIQLLLKIEQTCKRRKGMSNEERAAIVEWVELYVMDVYKSHPFCVWRAKEAMKER